MIVVASGTGPEGWITLLNAPARERNKVRPITLPAEDPAARVVKPQPAQAPTTPAPYTGASPEPILQQGLAAFNRLNGTLAAIHDEASANQRRNEVAAAMREIGDNIDKLVEFPDLPAEVTKRLNALYDPQYKAVGEQTKRELERIARTPGAGRVLSSTLQSEGLSLHMKASLAPMRQISAKLDRDRKRLMARHMAALTMPSPQESGDMFARYAEREVVEIVVQGLPVEAMDPVYQRLREISNCQASMSKGNGESARFTIAPIRDVRALAAKIDFGEVTVLHVSQSLIVVVADASKVAALPPPLPPPSPPARPLFNPSDPGFYRRNLEDLSSRDLSRRRAAADRLSSAEPKELRAEIAQAFITMLGDSDHGLRHRAVETLPVWATADEAVPRLIERLHDFDDGTVAKAIKALAEFKDLRAVGPLCERADRFGFQVHDALRKLGTPAEPEVIKYLNHPEKAVRITAIKALGDIGTSRCVPFLQQLAKCGDFFIEVEAKRALDLAQRRRS
jgi:hypothetical protein